jgi:DNA processing protein
MNKLAKNDKEFAYLALSLIPGIGPKTFKNIKDLYQKKYQTNPIEQLWSDLRKKNTQLLPQRLQNILNKINFLEIEKEAQKAIEWSEQTNNHIIFENDAHYPKLLLQISDPPPVLYVKGNLEILNCPQIAIVGARNMSRYGQKNASFFAKGLTQRNIIITSGLARGIDTIAHQSAIDALSKNGKSIAIMGTGLNYIYPKQNKKLAEQILSQNGALISELPLDTKVNKINFPRRNRIISGISIATLVVECSLKSGSLITARFALEQDKEVFTIPGPIDHPLAQGPHNLIQQGATLIQNINDILNEIPTWAKESKFKTYPNTYIHKKSNLNSNFKDPKFNILLYIDYEITPIDVIIRRTNLPPGLIKLHIMNLELESFIKSCPGGYIKLKEFS